MKCKNKKVGVLGVVFHDPNNTYKDNLECTITNDEHGKTLSIFDGHTQFTIPFEPIEKYLK